ncbi:MAG: DNA-binding protein WhiA [Lachnospiraceae bacterium]|nr:DNA-binding protein WhiA [Lachnospiraceae bacterium]
MSFSQDVKDELERQIGQARHCRIAELAVILLSYGDVNTTKIGKKQLVLATEHETIVRKYFTLLKKTFNIENSVLKTAFSTENAGRIFESVLEDEALIETILKAVKMWDEDHRTICKSTDVSDVLLKATCCKRAYLRGCFLCAGSMSDPQKGYHLEYLCNNEDMANQLLHVISDFDVEAKMVRRKKYYVVYIKEGASIVELLNVMEAHISLMNLENTRILKEIGNHTNRKVNCETANIIKAVNAANKQIAGIERIRDVKGLDSLPLQLREMAEIRLQYPDASLGELGKYLDPPIGKSGVNHRLRKLGEIADKLL